MVVADIKINKTLRSLVDSCFGELKPVNMTQFLFWERGWESQSLSQGLWRSVSGFTRSPCTEHVWLDIPAPPTAVLISAAGSETATSLRIWEWFVHSCLSSVLPETLPQAPRLDTPIARVLCCSWWSSLWNNNSSGTKNRLCSPGPWTWIQKWANPPKIHSWLTHS